MLCAYCFRTITGNIFDPGKRAASNVTVDGVLGDPSADAYVGVWSVVLVAGRSRRLSNVFSPMFFHYIPLPPPSSGSSYILRSPSVITPSHHSLQLIHCR